MLNRLTSQINHFNKINRFHFIKQKDLDQIERNHGNSNYQKTIMYFRIAKFIAKSGFQLFRTDMREYVNVKKRNLFSKKPISKEDKQFLIKMRKQLQRMKTIIFIQFMPFSGFLLLYYIYFYPTDLPSWFWVDSIYKNTQKEAIKYFQKQPLEQNFVLKQMPVQKLKMLSQLLFGHYQDGLTGYRSIYPQKHKQYLFSPSFSHYLIRRNIKKGLKFDSFNNQQITSMNLQQRISWKYNKIMKHKLLVQQQNNIKTKT